MEPIAFVQEAGLGEVIINTQGEEQKVQGTEGKVLLKCSEQSREFLRQINPGVNAAVILGPQKEGKSTLLNSLVGAKRFKEGADDDYTPTTQSIDMIHHEDWLLFDTEGTENPNREDDGRHFHNLFLTCFLTAKVLILLDDVKNLCRNSELLKSTLTRAFQNTRGFDRSTRRKLIIAAKCKELSNANRDLVKQRITTYWNKSFQDGEEKCPLDTFYVIEVVGVPFDEERQTYKPEAVAAMWEQMRTFPAVQNTTFLLEMVDTLLPQLNSDSNLNLPDIERQASLRSSETIMTSIVQEYRAFASIDERAKDIAKVPKCWEEDLRCRLSAVRLPEEGIAAKIHEVAPEFKKIRKQAEQTVVQSETEAFLQAYTEKAEDPRHASDVLQSHTWQTEFQSRLQHWQVRQEFTNAAANELNLALDPIRARAQTTILKQYFDLPRSGVPAAAEFINKDPDNWTSRFDKKLKGYVLDQATKEKLYKELEPIVVASKSGAMAVLDGELLTPFLEGKLDELANSSLGSYQMLMNPDSWKSELEQRLKAAQISEAARTPLLERFQPRGGQIKLAACEMVIAYCRADVQYHRMKLHACEVNRSWLDIYAWSSNLDRLKGTLEQNLRLINPRYVECIQAAIAHKQDLFLRVLGKALSSKKTRNIISAVVGVVGAATFVGGVAAVIAFESGALASVAVAATLEISGAVGFYSSLGTLIVSIKRVIGSLFDSLPGELVNQLQEHFEELTRDYKELLTELEQSKSTNLLLTLDKEVFNIHREDFQEYDLEVILAKIQAAKDEAAEKGKR